MAEIVQVFTIARILLAPDSIPWAAVLSPSSIQQLRERYKFQQVLQSPPANTQVVAASGEFAGPTLLQPVQQLQLEANAIQFQISGTSDECEAFYKSLVEFFQTLPGANASAYKEYTRTFQTIAVVRLNVPFEAMLSEEMREFLLKVIPQLSRDDAAAHLRLTSLNWQVTYEGENRDFTYSPKVLAIEPRAGSNPEDRLYYTQSPTEFSVHKALIQEFEKMLAREESRTHSSRALRSRVSSR